MVPIFQAGVVVPGPSEITFPLHAGFFVVVMLIPLNPSYDAVRSMRGIIGVGGHVVVRDVIIDG